MKKKQGIVLGVVALLSALSLSACVPQAPTAPSAPAATDKVIVVGASSVPHAEILKAAQKNVEDQGYKLEIKEFSDYVLPNTALDAGELDANYFQHVPYLEDFNKEHNLNLVSAGGIHFEPLGLFSVKEGRDYRSIPQGAKIAVPSDTTNEARALLLLSDLGILKLKDNADLSATKKDIVENPYNVEIVEAEAASLPRLLEDVDFAVINGNYALSSGLPADAVQASENAQSQAAQTFANVVAVKSENKDTEKTRVLVKALQSDEVRKFINNTYKDKVVAIF